MGLSLGNISIKDVYFGSTKIKEMYLGSSKVYSSSVYPYFIFEFADSSINPNRYSHNLVNDRYDDKVIWTQLSSSPNIWKIEIIRYTAVQEQMGIGLPCLFAAGTGDTTGILTMSCKLIGSGNFDYVDIYSQHCTSFDRTFAHCTGLTEITPILYAGTYLINVGSMFNNCINITTGALAQYNWFNTYGVNINNHSGTFTNCGSNTQTGAAELAQIPVGWGGTLVPASTLMTSARGKWKNNYDIWTISANNPDWTNMNGLYLFTEASVSSYAGVSMNRSRIAKFNGLISSSAAALYFYPCFMQHTSTAITWAVTTGSPNGSLANNQGNTDMPGTLDYSTYGPFSHEFGTYDSAGTVYFCFLVTNDPISSSFNLSSSPYGVLYNGNFKTDAGLRWFF